MTTNAAEQGRKSAESFGELGGPLELDERSQAVADLERLGNSRRESRSLVEGFAGLDGTLDLDGLAPCHR